MVAVIFLSKLGFDFVPKLLFIYYGSSSAYPSSLPSASSTYGSTYWFSGMDILACASSNQSWKNYVTLNNNTLSWYNVGGGWYQQYNAEATYKYIAIG